MRQKGHWILEENKAQVHYSWSHRRKRCPGPWNQALFEHVMTTNDQEWVRSLPLINRTRAWALINDSGTSSSWLLTCLSFFPRISNLKNYLALYKWKEWEGGKLFQNPINIIKGLDILVQIKATPSSHSRNISGKINSTGKPNLHFQCYEEVKLLSWVKFYNI